MFAGLLQDATVDALRDSVRRHMPTGPLRDYYQWGLDPAQPRQPKFLQVTGVTQLANLYARLAHGLVDEALWPKISELLARIAVYQAYEIVSDNLALGLAGSAAAEPDGGRGAELRRQLLRTFNTAMTVRLRGSGRTADILLTPERRRARRLSTLDQSLAGHAHRELAAQLPGGQKVEDIERGVWPALVANIEAAVELAGTLEGTLLGPLVHDGLTERYRGVTRTLSSRHLSRLELAAIGAHTVLVAPTLAYCIGVVADLAHPVPGLADVVADGSLAEVLNDAAVLARLLNDVGTGLLDLPARQRRSMLRGLGDSSGGLDALIPAGPPFSRLAKDLRHGEFNIVLYGARRAPHPVAALEALESDLDYYARLYRLHRSRLGTGLARLTRRLADDRPAALVSRFMDFHTALYANSYAEAAGEYAI